MINKHELTFTNNEGLKNYTNRIFKLESCLKNILYFVREDKLSINVDTFKYDKWLDSLEYITYELKKAAELVNVDMDKPRRP